MGVQTTYGGCRIHPSFSVFFELQFVKFSFVFLQSLNQAPLETCCQLMCYSSYCQLLPPHIYTPEP